MKIYTSNNISNKNSYETFATINYRFSRPCIKRYSRKNYKLSDACARFASLKSPTGLTSLKTCGTSQ